ncbi:hypothetical protein DFH07DRAFT_37816 [Mycena maculata]|uniref:Uncharacterized protein n=1 Tax=Mycena maculata TaxID=230809 RepID=A0AAD7IGL1_9AGAR|nr:hypothetical protein DFH07DRAFT_37816 [Mycena maculata]
MEALWSLAGARYLTRSKLLVNSKLPVTVPSTPSGIWKLLNNISVLPGLRGAFGMTSEDVASVFSVLSRGRVPRRDLDVDARDSRLPEYLGIFLPPALRPENISLGLPIYSFKIVLHYATKALDLGVGHEALPAWPLLTQISGSPACRRLLEFSSLRRERPVHLPPVHVIKWATLGSIYKSEETLWTVLFSLGILKVTEQRNHLQFAPLWGLQISNPFAKQQVHVIRYTDVQILIS